MMLGAYSTVAGTVHGEARRGGYVCVSGFVLLLLVTYDCLVLAGVDGISFSLID